MEKPNEKIFVTEESQLRERTAADEQRIAKQRQLNETLEERKRLRKKDSRAVLLVGIVILALAILAAAPLNLMEQLALVFIACVLFAVTINKNRSSD
jgi:hypothetical protein